MSVVMTSVEGSPAVQIETPDGKTRTYLFRVERRPTGAWLLSLKQDSGKAYTVACSPRGAWSCNCPAFTYNVDRAEVGCKHIRTGKELKQLLEAMS